MHAFLFSYILSFFSFQFLRFLFCWKVFKGLSENFMLGVYWRSLHGEWLASHISPSGTFNRAMGLIFSRK